MISNYDCVVSLTSSYLKSDISVVVPTFRSHTTLPELVERIVGIPGWSPNSEILIIDDGNSDATWATIQTISHNQPQVIGFQLQQNVGQHAAILCGVRSARNSIIVTLDDDLQNPPEEIPRLVNTLGDSVDVAIGLPHISAHSLARNNSSRISKKLLKMFIGYDHAELISPFRAFKTHLRDTFKTPLGPNVSIDALLALASSRFKAVNVEHVLRQKGKSNYSFKTLSRFFVTTATSVSVVPLKFATRLGLVTLLGALVIALVTVIRTIVVGSAVTGFPFLVVLITTMSGVNLLVLGLLGQYIGHMHFRLIGTPSYVVIATTSNYSLGEPKS